MSFDYEKVIPSPIPMKRAKDPKSSFKNMDATYIKNIKNDAPKISKLYREKIEADRKRLGLL